MVCDWYLQDAVLLYGFTESQKGWIAQMLEQYSLPSRVAIVDTGCLDARFEDAVNILDFSHRPLDSPVSGLEDEVCDSHGVAMQAINNLQPCLLVPNPDFL